MSAPGLGRRPDDLQCHCGLGRLVWSGVANLVQQSPEEPVTESVLAEGVAQPSEQTAMCHLVPLPAEYPKLWMLAAASAASWVQAACRDVRHVRYRRRLYAVPAPMAAPMTAPPRTSLG